MNIYEIKKELNNNKVIKYIKKSYKDITGDVVKIKIKKLDETKDMEQLALVLEFWSNGEYENDYYTIESYWQTKKRTLKEYKKESYELYYEIIKNIIKNECEYDKLQPADYDNVECAFCQSKYNTITNEWQFWYNKVDGTGWYTK